MNAQLEQLAAQLRQNVGKEAVPFSRKVEAGALVKFSRATGQTDPVFLDAANGPIAPPTYISTFSEEAVKDLLDVSLPLPMFLHTDDVAEMGVPIRGGDTISATAKCVDVFTKTGKRGAMLFQTAEIVLRNQRSDHVATLRVSVVNF